MTGLPKGWTLSPLLAAVELYDSQRIPLNASERAKRQGPFPYYGANGLVDHVDSYIFDGDFVLLAEDGGNFDKPERGVAYEASGRFWVNNHAHILKPRADMPVRFLRHWLNAVDWMPYVGGTTRAKLTQAGMSRINIPLPPYTEQRRIVAKLDSLTGRTALARDDLERIPRLMQKYLDAILTAAFHGELTASWRAKRGRGSPASVWSYTSLGSLLIEGPINGWSPQSSNDANGAATLKLTATTSGYLRLDDDSTKRIHETPPRNSKYWLKPGDLLLQRGNTIDYVGTAAIYDGPEHSYIYPDLMMKIRLPSKELTRYAWRYINSPEAKAYFRSKATGTAGNMPKINANAVRSLPVPLPPPDEMSEILTCLEAAFAWLDRIKAEHANASRLLPKLDRAILAKAFRGELVPQDPNDEPVTLNEPSQEGARRPRGRRKSA
jgi:type I restriction enzyme S subunit